MKEFSIHGGIIGAGQLAQMLVEAGHALGLNLAILGPDGCRESEPAGQVLNDPRLWFDESKSADFFKLVSPVLFENEFADTRVLEHAGAFCVPKLELIKMLKNKIAQKKFLLRHGIGTAPFLKSDDSDGILAAKKVFKWAELGYDGYGTLIVKADDSEALAARQAFFQKAQGKGVEVFAEQKIAFKRELAMVGVRDSRGKVFLYPLVWVESKHGACHIVRGPAHFFDVALDRQTEAEAIVSKILNELEYVGILAVEFFEDEAGQLWVNELAPRVHNTAHFSIEACEVSQFENHLRATILGEAKPPLPKSLKVPGSGCGAFVMLNLLAPKDLNQTVPAVQPVFNLDASMKLHWYQKKTFKPGRKMGHLTYVGQSKQDVETALAYLFTCETAWFKTIKHS